MKLHFGASASRIDDRRFIVTNGVLVVTLALTLVLAGQGSISVGDAAVAIVGLQQLSSRLQSAGAAFNGVHQGHDFSARLRDVSGDASGDSLARRPTGVPPAPPSVLSVDKLTYRYPGATVDAVRCQLRLEQRPGDGDRRGQQLRQRPRCPNSCASCCSPITAACRGMELTSPVAIRRSCEPDRPRVPGLRSLPPHRAPDNRPR